MTEMKAGLRLTSAVCDGQIMVIKPGANVALTCGGAPMLAGDEPPADAALDAAHTAGCQVGKRYVNEDQSVEVAPHRRSMPSVICGPMGYCVLSEQRVQRRLTAILSADVVGYSRLMGKDEAGTLAALKGHREKVIDPIVAEHGGRVVKLMGDGALIEFPSVVDAVECAGAIQRGLMERILRVNRYCSEYNRS